MRKNDISTPLGPKLSLTKDMKNDPLWHSMENFNAEVA